MKVNIKNYPNPDGVLFKMGVNTEQSIFVKIDEWDTFNMDVTLAHICLLYTSPSPRDTEVSRMPSSA